MAVIPTQQISVAGTLPTYQAAAGGGDQFEPDLRTILHVKNGGASPITVTIVTPGTAFGEQIADAAIVVTNAQERMIGPFDPAGFTDPATGMALVSYTAVTSVTVAAIRI